MIDFSQFDSLISMTMYFNNEDTCKQAIIETRWGTRLYVHLSQDEETAIKVGSRHGSPFVLKIDSEQMFKNGIKFYLSNNNVWLTDFVDKKYIIN